ncbi:MAG: hypothetical protein AMXMBFR53_36490 [Gemmatimonadota bacterium]
MTRAVLALALLLLATPTPEKPFAISVGIRPMFPSPLHLVYVEMVKGCLGVTDPAFRAIAWATAEQIVLVETGVQAYGMSDMDENAGTALIVIERPYWFHPSVITHELTHVLLGERDDNPTDPAWRCVMGFPEGLALRPTLSPDSVRALLRAVGKPPSKE